MHLHFPANLKKVMLQTVFDYLTKSKENEKKKIICDSSTADSFGISNDICLKISRHISSKIKRPQPDCPCEMEDEELVDNANSQFENEKLNESGLFTFQGDASNKEDSNYQETESIHDNFRTQILMTQEEFIKDIFNKPSCCYCKRVFESNNDFLHLSCGHCFHINCIGRDKNCIECNLDD